MGQARREQRLKHMSERESIVPKWNFFYTKPTTNPCKSETPCHIEVQFICYIFASNMVLCHGNVQVNKNRSKYCFLPLFLNRLKKKQIVRVITNSLKSKRTSKWVPTFSLMCYRKNDTRTSKITGPSERKQFRHSYFIKLR